MKPILYIGNVSEEQLSDKSTGKQISKLSEYDFIFISAKIESDLNELSQEDKKEYLKELGMEETGLDLLINKAYEKLGLITFFTSGEKETRAWTTLRGATAPEAAGVIHTDFAKGFIAAEVIPWQDFYAQGGWTGAKAHGLVRTEGKTYLFQDGDVVIFRFNV
jgi:ribosome-binding ATPase YchF (GTP1/OBG family)